MTQFEKHKGNGKNEKITNLRKTNKSRSRKKKKGVKNNMSVLRETGGDRVSEHPDDPSDCAGIPFGAYSCVFAIFMRFSFLVALFNSFRLITFVNRSYCSTKETTLIAS